MTENRSYNCTQGQGQGHLGDMTHCLTHLVTADMPCTGLLKRGKFFVKIKISLQITGLWPKIGFWQVSNSNAIPNRNHVF